MQLRFLLPPVCPSGSAFPGGEVHTSIPVLSFSLSGILGSLLRQGILGRIKTYPPSAVVGNLAFPSSSVRSVVALTFDTLLLNTRYIPQQVFRPTIMGT